VTVGSHFGSCPIGKQRRVGRVEQRVDVSAMASRRLLPVAVEIPKVAQSFDGPADSSAIYAECSGDRLL